MPYLLGVDNGGTMTKAAIFTTDGKEVVIAAKETPVHSPHEGYFERDMLDLWNTTATCIRQALEKAGISGSEIAAVGCSGHGKGLYLWGKDGKPAYPAIASTDHRATDIIKRWNMDGTQAAASKLALQPIIDCQPVALLAWLKEHQPDVLTNIRWIFEAKDYIRFMLTGKARAEMTDYSGTGLMNLKTHKFDRELLSLFGIESLADCLPPLCLSYEVAGHINADAAKLTGLCEGTPVCGGMFDIDACAVAMDVTQPNQLCTITGTWSINEYPAPEPVRSDTSTHNSLFCVPGVYLIEESSQTSAGNLEWFLQNFLKAEKEQSVKKGQSFYDEINQLVDDLSPADSNVLFLPFLYGSNTEPALPAGFFGLSGSHSKAHMLRAIYEGVAFSHLWHIEKLLAFRNPPETVRMAGGAVNSSVWVQMFADVLNIPIETVSTKELGAKGCAMAAAIAAGIYTDYEDAAKAMVKISSTIYPRQEYVENYRKKYERYKDILNRLTN